MKVLFYKNYVSKDLKGLSGTDRKIFKNFIDFVKLKDPPISDPHISKLKGFENIFRFKKIGKKVRIIFLHGK